MNNTRDRKIKRHKRVRAKVKGSEQKPRLSVFRSSRHIYAQLINDEAGLTVAQFNDSVLNVKKNNKISKIETAKSVGKALGEQVLEKGFKEIVFDRGGYKYHGRIKALAEGLREVGVKF